ncbi:MAG: FAD:protein FMN transferase [Spirochaetia bacterium]
MPRFPRHLLFVILLCTALVSCRPSVHRETRFSMSSTLTVLVSSQRPPDWQDLFDFADRKAWEFDHRQKDSPIGKLNREGGGKPPGEVLEVLKTAQRIAVLSDGAFDPTILALTDLWAFDGGGSLPTDEQIDSARRRVDFSKVVIDKEGTVRIPEGFGLDLGGIAKGAVVDLISGYLYERGFKDFLIDAGGDILVSGVKQGETLWRIAVRHPRESQAVLGVIPLGEKDSRIAMVTSGDYERFFESGGKRYHHILDPRSGYPAGQVASVTVIAPTCEVADALSTAAFVLGPERGLKLLEEFPDAEGLLIAEEDGNLTAWKTKGFPIEVDSLRFGQE